MDKGLDVLADAPATEVETASDEIMDSVALARVLAEVRNDDVTSPTSYNRMHNRHNRS